MRPQLNYRTGNWNVTPDGQSKFNFSAAQATTHAYLLSSSYRQRPWNAAPSARYAVGSSDGAERRILVDLGYTQRTYNVQYHAVSTDTHNHTEFFSGKAVNQRKDRFARVRKLLQRKGTRSATRRLVLLSGRERRFIAARNHSLASQILNAYPQAVIGLENLKDIRERAEGRRSKKTSKKARKARRRRSQWSFAELQTFIAYKAPLRGNMAIWVDANYTSQMCIKCGHTSKANRPNSGLMFVCENCGYQVHSDLLGARNINMRTLAVRQDWAATGCLSYTPDVSGGEAKAVRLQRYAELRWSPDTSPRL